MIRFNFHDSYFCDTVIDIQGTPLSVKVKVYNDNMAIGYLFCQG